MRLVQLDISQVQYAAPQAIELQIGIQAFEGDLLLVGFANLQAPEAEFQAERVELQALQRGGYFGVLRQLLVGDAQTDTGQNQKAQQAVEGNGDGNGAGSALYSFKHKNVIYPDEKCLGVWHACAVPQRLCAGIFCELARGSELQD